MVESSNTKYTLRISSPSTCLHAGLSGSVELLDQLEGLTVGEVRLLLAAEVNAGKDENTFSIVCLSSGHVKRGITRQSSEDRGG